MIKDRLLCMTLQTYMCKERTDMHAATCDRVVLVLINQLLESITYLANVVCSTSHFETFKRPFWSLRYYKRIKKLNYQRLFRIPENLGKISFWTPLVIWNRRWPCASIAAKPFFSLCHYDHHCFGHIMAIAKADVGIG